MSERLTKRTENGGVQFSNGEYWNTVYPQNENCLTDIHRMAIKLCDLEDKIEQGKIVELPCKVGDTLFAIYHSPKRKVVCVFEYEVTEIVYCSNRGVRPWVISCFGGRKFDNCDFGKTVFLERSAAEAKLREMEGDNNEQR